MNDAEGDADLELVRRRADFLEALQGEPLHKPDLVEQLGHSRSTVDRAIRDLEEAGLVERVTRGYVRTQTGRLLLDRYRSFRADQEAIIAAKDVLDDLPQDVSVPVSLVTDATVEPIASVYRLFERLAETVPSATEYRAVLPTIVDSRHIRLCHDRVVRGELATTLVSSSETVSRLRNEFPHLADELAEAAAFTAHSGSVPPYGLLLLADDEGSETVVLITYEEGAVSGFVRTDDPEAVDWARRRYEDVLDETREATADLAASSDVAGLPPVDGGLPQQLRTEGFVRVDESYFDRRDPLDVPTSWRAGLSLPAVAAGQAVERTDDRGESLTETVLDRVLAGQDTAVIGPSGAGKSTLCKQVACRWREETDGVVLYREHGETVESTAALEAVIERERDPVLVVVEDAARPEASAVFDVLAAFSGREDVTFLVDADEAEWHERTTPLDAAVEAHRQSAVDPVFVSEPDETDRQRFRDALVERTGEALDDPETSAETPGGLVVLVHRLSRQVEPMAPYGPGGAPTTLDEDVSRLRADLAEIGPRALDAGTLAALLIAADRPIHPVYFHAVATDEDERQQVAAALGRLRGDVLFDPTGDDEPFRSVHARWAIQFLDRLAEADEAAPERATRTLTAFLELADRADRREAVEAGVGADPTGLTAIVTAPGSWVDETVSAIFEAGVRTARLAPLLGATGDDGVSLPEVCSREARLGTLACRGWMNARAGDTERAREAFERLADAGDPRHRLESHLGRCRIDRVNGALDSAREHAETAAEIATDLSGPGWICRAHLATGHVARRKAAYEEADAAFEAALSAAREADSPGLEAAALTHLGRVARRRGASERAGELLDSARERYRALGDRRGEMEVRHALGLLARQRGDHDRAGEVLPRGLDQARELGDSEYETKFLQQLGNVAYVEAEYDEARTYYEAAVEATEASGNRHGLRRALSMVSAIARAQGDLETAGEAATRSLSVARGIDEAESIADSLCELTLVRRLRGDLAGAVEAGEEALDLAGGIENPRLQGDAALFLASVLLHRGETDTARDHLETALSNARDLGYPIGEARALRYLARAASLDDDTETAVEHVETALGMDVTRATPTVEIGCQALRARIALADGDAETARAAADRALEVAESVPSRPGATQAHLAAGAVASERGNHERAVDHAEQALEIATTDGFGVLAIRARVLAGTVASERGDHERAERLLTTAVDDTRERGATVLADSASAALAALGPEASAE